MRKLILAILVAGLIVGCSGGIVRPRVEKGIENALPQYIGPAKEYKVQADGSTTSMMDGLIERLHIEGREVQIDPKLLLSRILVDMSEVRYHPRTRELTSVKSTVFQAAVSESAVNRYIEQAREGEAKLQVRLEPGKIRVEFVPSVVGVDVLISISGRPEIAAGDKVNFVADSGSVAHLPVPSYVVNKVLDRVNPILDMALMKFPVSLKDIVVKKNEVVIKGSADFKP